MKKDITGYSLSRDFFDWCFENPEKITPTHIAMYFFIIEHCNRLGWKEKFGLPTSMVKDAIGIRNFRTYTNTLNDLVDWGFIKMIEKSKNQYTSNIVAIAENAIARTKALDKATQKQHTKQRRSIDSILKQENNTTNITYNNTDACENNRISSHTDTNRSHSIASIAVNDNVNVSVNDNVNVIKKKKYNIAAWANDFDIYLTDLRNAYTEIQEDSEWIEQQKKFYNNTVDIIKSIEKSCVNYWATEAGWQKKRKSKPQPKKINWKTTFANAISLGSNKVYIKQANSNKPHINNLTGDEEYTIF